MTRIERFPPFKAVDVGGHVACALVIVAIADFSLRRDMLKKGFEVESNYRRGSPFALPDDAVNLRHQW
jgi:hypothetical protein